MTIGIILVLLAAFSWGSAIVMSKISLNALDASSLFFYQIISATVLSWFVPLMRGKGLSLTKSSLLAYSTGLFEPFLTYILAIYGLEKISAGIASVIFSLESAFILILSILIFRMSIKSPWIFMIFLTSAMVGSLLTVYSDIEEKDGTLTGYLLVVSGVLAAAFYVVISSKLVESFDPMVLLTGQLTFSTGLAVLFLLVTDNFAVLPLHSVVVVVMSGVLQYFLAFIFYLYALQRVPVYIAGAILYFIPINVLVLSWLFLGERLTSIQIVGIIITITSILLLNRKYRHQ